MTHGAFPEARENTVGHGFRIVTTPLAFAENPSAAAMSTRQSKTTGHRTCRCTTLDAQFDKAKAAHWSDQEALALQTEGETLCSSNQQAAGVKYLESALKTIEAQPKI